MDAAGLRAVVDAYFERLNGEDWDGLTALFAPTARLRAPGGAWSGRARIAAYYRAALAPYPEHWDQPTRTLLHAAGATVEIRFTGTTATGVRLEFDAVDVFDVADGAIVALSSWYDSHAVRRQLADATAAGASGESAS